jgi:fatty-acyl-CoA synthase
MSNTQSYAHGASPVLLLGETIGDNLRRTVERFGNREALVIRHQNIHLTYHQLWELSTRCALGLLAHGVQKGDRVGIWAPNRYEWVVLQYAAARVGAILVNINPAYKAAELEYALRQSGVSLLVLARGFPPGGLRGHARRSPRGVSGAARGARARRRLGGPAGQWRWQR